MSHYSDDTRTEYNSENSLMSEAGQNVVEEWDW